MVSRQLSTIFPPIYLNGLDFFFRKTIKTKLKLQLHHNPHCRSPGDHPLCTPHSFFTPVGMMVCLAHLGVLIVGTCFLYCLLLWKLRKQSKNMVRKKIINNPLKAYTKIEINSYTAVLYCKCHY